MSSNLRFASSNPLVRRLKALFARLKAKAEWEDLKAPVRRLLKAQVQATETIKPRFK